MIELNLLPKDLRAAKKKHKMSIKMEMPKLPLIPIGLGLVSALVLCQVLVSFISFTQNKRLVRLTAELEKISGQEKVAEGLRKDAEKLNKKVSVIDLLASSSLIWSKKLYDLKEAMIEGVWLTSLQLTTEQPKIRSSRSQKRDKGTPKAAEQPLARQALILRGSTVSPTSGEETGIIGRFMESLRNNKGFFSDFEDIKLSSIQRKKLGEREVMDFSIICYFKTGRSYFEKLEG